MTSLRARLINLALPLLGIKSFMSEPDRVEERLEKARKRKPQRPNAKWRKKFDIVEEAGRGYPVVTITPRDVPAAGAPHLLYLHGGYVLDIVSQHFDTVCRLCEQLGASATVPIYPLAPEHEAPQVLAAMRALYDDVIARHDAGSVTVMGDSAGGGMSLALAQMLRSDGGTLPGSLVLWSPWLDATASAEGQAAIEPSDRMLAQVGLVKCAQLYGGGLPVEDPRLSPLFGALDGLPPTAIFAGTRDILIVDARRLAARFRDAGKTDFGFHEYESMFHVWMLMPFPESNRALAQTAAFIRQANAR